MIHDVAKFFEDWEDSYKIFPALFLITFFMIVLLLWVPVNAPAFKDQSDIFFKFIIVALIAVVFDFGYKNFIKNSDPEGNKRILSFSYAGKSYATAGIALVIGFAFSAFVFFTNFIVISTPLNSVQTSTIVASFLFSVIVAPYAEELFFRMWFFPTILNIAGPRIGRFKAWIICVLLTCSAFSFFHFLVFSAGLNLMIAAFLFSFIAIVGNRVFESSYFGWGFHLGNNYWVFGGILALLAGLI